LVFLRSPVGLFREYSGSLLTLGGKRCMCRPLAGIAVVVGLFWDFLVSFGVRKRCMCRPLAGVAVTVGRPLAGVAVTAGAFMSF